FRKNRKEKCHDHAGRSEGIYPALQGSRIRHTRRRGSRLRKQRRLRGADRPGKGRLQPQRTHPPAKGGRERFAGNDREDQVLDSGSENKRDHSDREKTGGNSKAELTLPQHNGDIYGKGIPSNTESVPSEERSTDQSESGACPCLCEPGASNPRLGKQDTGQEQQEIPVGEKAHREFQFRRGSGGRCGRGSTCSGKRRAGFRFGRKSTILV